MRTILKYTRGNRRGDLDGSVAVASNFCGQHPISRIGPSSRAMFLGHPYISHSKQACRKMSQLRTVNPQATMLIGARMISWNVQVLWNQGRERNTLTSLRTWSYSDVHISSVKVALSERSFSLSNHAFCRWSRKDIAFSGGSSCGPSQIKVRNTIAMHRVHCAHVVIAL